MTYEAVAQFAHTWGLALLVVLFTGVLVYALWPGNRRKFDRAARLPLEEDETWRTDRK
jgi:cytochrome c oxidase cbb3-type subunit 4